MKKKEDPVEKVVDLKRMKRRGYIIPETAFSPYSLNYINIFSSEC